MADPGDLSKNPFAALFPSIDVAEQYSAESSRKYGENKQSGTRVIFCFLIVKPDINKQCKARGFLNAILSV